MRGACRSGSQGSGGSASAPAGDPLTRRFLYVTRTVQGGKRDADPLVATLTSFVHTARFDSREPSTIGSATRCAHE
jgi:hypothetical protein